MSHAPSAWDPRPSALATWPSAADYQTIKTAVAVRNEALFHERDWRRKSFAALLAARTVLTVRIAAGRCAAYVTELYGNLRDLMDAYPGEDWLPLIRVVRREPPLAEACRQPAGGAARTTSWRGAPRPHLRLPRWIRSSAATVA
ncbi:MAG: hypothetical protein JOZ98_23530 [Solirubrobacterales bacterium]|nr:hypothetical protein [Solirubrobacterales bacterium]MBV9798807.1 hypothetical protein [Solirubrobacterales bacterium]